MVGLDFVTTSHSTMSNVYRCLSLSRRDSPSLWREKTKRPGKLVWAGWAFSTFRSGFLEESETHKSYSTVVEP